MLNPESEEWIRRYNGELRLRDLDDYIEGVLEAKAFFRETFLTRECTPKTSEPERAWAVVCNLWAVLTTRKLGNPRKLLDGGRTKAYLAKQLDDLVAAACGDFDTAGLFDSGHFEGLGESMRTELIYKLFPSRYPIKNWKSECGLTIVNGALDFVEADYTTFIRYGEEVLAQLANQPKIKRIYEPDLKFAFLDHFLGHYIYYHDDVQYIINSMSETHSHFLNG